MKRMIVIILVMFLIAGGVGGGLIMLGVIPNPFNPQGQGAAEEEEEKGMEPPTAALTFVKPEDMILPVIINGRVTRRIYITVRIIAAAGGKATIETRMSRYQNEMIQDLLPYFQNYFTDNRRMDLVEIKKKFNSHARNVFGEAAAEVLLVNIFDQGAGTVR